MADGLTVEVVECVEGLLHQGRGLLLGQGLGLRDEVEQFSSFAQPINNQATPTYSVTKKHMRSVSQVSCSFMMFGWSYSALSNSKVLVL